MINKEGSQRAAAAMAFYYTTSSLPFNTFNSQAKLALSLAASPCAVRAPRWRRRGPSRRRCRPPAPAPPPRPRPPPASWAAGEARGSGDRGTGGPGSTYSTRDATARRGPGGRVDDGQGFGVQAFAMGVPAGTPALLSPCGTACCTRTCARSWRTASSHRDAAD